MAKRKCPLCKTGEIESWPGQSLRISAKQHYAIVHMGDLSEKELRQWQEFYNKLPKVE